MSMFSKPLVTFISSNSLKYREKYHTNSCYIYTLWLHLDSVCFIIVNLVDKLISIGVHLR